MRNITLLTGTMLFLPMTATAQSINCTPSPDCASLGYTESSCPDGAGIKCPWGNTWFCTKEKCDTSFQYTCSGTGYAGGASEACNGKYQQCMCTSGYEWKNGACQKKPAEQAEWGKCNGYAQNCNIGDFIFSDRTCSSQKILGKTPIAVVVYKSADGNCAQAMALNVIGKHRWSGISSDVPGLTNYTSAYEASQDVNSCQNTKTIIAKDVDSAAVVTQEYMTAGTSAGDWCLPAAGIATSIKKNRSAINRGFNLAGGSSIEQYDSYYWTSSEHDRNLAWCLYLDPREVGGDEYGLNSGSCTKSWGGTDVRPVLEF